MMTAHELALEISALHQQAMQAEQNKNYKVAKKSYERILEISPDHAGVKLNLANLLIKLNQLIEAIPFYKQLQESHPENSSFSTTLGDLYKATKRLNEAIDYYKKALNNIDNKTPALTKIASIYLTQNDLHSTIAYLSWAYTEDSQNVQTNYSLAKCFHALLDKNKALAYIKQAYEIDNKNEDICIFYANLLANNGEHQGALTIYQSIEKTQANSERILENIGKCLYELGRHEEAMGILSKVLEINVNNFKIHYYLGNILSALGEYNKAIEHFKAVLQLNPEFPEAQYNLSLCYLSLSQYKQGLELYSWRWCIENYKRDFLPFPYPIWDGSLHDNLELLIWDEQGIGDTIFFARSLRFLSKQNLNLTLFCEPRLISLFQRSYPDIKFYPKPSKTEAKKFTTNKFDAQIPLGDLAYFTYNMIDESQYLQSNTAYLEVNSNLSKAFSNKYGTKPKVGISWKTNAQKNGYARTIALEEWKALIESMPDICWVNIQYGDTANEWSHLMSQLNVDHVLDHSVNALSDMDTFAAQLDSLDAIISIDNSTAHLAGALGKPTWCLIPKVHDWRWPLNSEHCPWYNKMTIYKNHTHKWQDVLEKVRKNLCIFLENNQ